MRKEYKLAKVWTITLWIILPALAAGFMWLSFSSFLAENTDFAYIPYLRIISFILAIIMLIALTGFARSKLVLSEGQG